MKRIFILLALVSCLFINPLQKAQAQEAAKDFRYTVKTNPLAVLGSPFWFIVIPVTGEYRVLFEAQTTPKQSLQIGLGYVGPSSLVNLEKLSDSIASIGVSGFRGQLTYKFFVTKNGAPEGLYLAPYVSYATVKIKSKANTANYLKGTKINYAGIIGYQLISDGGFCLDIYTGLGIKDRTWSVGAEAFSQEWNADFLKGVSGVSVSFGFNFGYAF